MKVLHIANWYPNASNCNEAIWIKRHIESLSDSIDDYFVLHLEIKPANKIRLRRRKIAKGIQRTLEIPLKSWFVIEIITAAFLVYYLVRVKFKKFDIINFHIAYPILTYWHIIGKWINLPVLITEHWSAYHYNFGLPETHKLKKIQGIFRQNIPVITVSQALSNDLRSFAKADFPTFVVPNVVDESIFYRDNQIEKKNFFFMVSQWRYPKNPIPVLAAFLRFNKENQHEYVVKIGGYGPLWNDIQDWIETYDLTNSITLLGVMGSKDIADNMRSCKAFLHPTNYETFSVVCAEAVSCGAFVVAPKIGGLPEVVNENGILLEKWEEENWYEALSNVIKRGDSVVLQDYGNRFSKNEVMRVYYNVLKEIIGETDK